MYTKKFVPERYLEIKPILEKIQKLSPGEVLLVRDSNESLYSIRWLLYDWLYHMGLKNLFKIATEEPNLRIIRKKNLHFETKREQVLLSDQAKAVLVDLLMLDEKELDEAVAKEVEKGSLDKLEVKAVKEQWRITMK